VAYSRADATLALSPRVLADFNCLLAMRDWEKCSKWHHELHLRMDTDASSHGWGAVLYVSPIARCGGPFTPDQLPLHINPKEVLAVRYGLDALGHRIPAGSRLELYVDNTVAQSAALRGSSTDDLMQQLALDILRWQLQANVVISIHRVTSKANVIADFESRRFAPAEAATVPPHALDQGTASIERGNHRLNPGLFVTLQCLVRERFTIDACAYPENAQCPRFISREWTKGCVAADVFSYSFPPVDGRREYIYCNPPWNLIAAVWAHFRQQRCQGVLLFPFMPLRSWYGTVVADAARVGVLARQGAADVFLQPSRQYRSSVGPIPWDLMFAVFDFS
jgi:hypothetical protein